MSKIITQCPSCSSLKLNVVKIECLDCSTKFEGHFAIPDILKLSPEDLQFIIDFVKCSGSLKEMAGKQNVSYPTLRNRLNSLIATIEHIENNKNSGSDKENILKLLEEGKISASEAAKMLKKL
jgi:hypothetical protein